MTVQDKDLIQYSKDVSSNYPKTRDTARGRAVVENIQSIRDLNKTIEKLNEQNSKLERKVFYLTWAMVFLAVIQIVLALFK